MHTLAWAASPFVRPPAGFIKLYYYHSLFVEDVLLPPIPTPIGTEVQLKGYLSYLQKASVRRASFDGNFNVTSTFHTSSSLPFTCQRQKAAASDTCGSGANKSS